MGQTQSLTKGAQRLLYERGFKSLREFKLPNNRRADLMGVNNKGQFVIVEVKSSLADFQSDQKWQEYLEYADFFAFAVGEDFPTDVLPLEHGVIIADNFGGAVVRAFSSRKLTAARRKSLLIAFGCKAAERFWALQDPDYHLSPTQM